MKNECNIVRDLLPLYIENMASPESAQFVEAHLSKCPECNAFYFEMIDKGEENIDDLDVKNKILPLQIVKKKLIKRIVISMISVILSVAVLISAGVGVYEYVDKQNKTAEIYCGASEYFTLEERKAAIDYLFRDVLNFMDFGYDIISVSYAGDSRCFVATMERYGLDFLNTGESDWDGEYYMVIHVDMKTPFWGNGKTFAANTYYEDIEYVLKRCDDGYFDWQAVFVSIPSPYPEATSAAE